MERASLENSTDVPFERKWRGNAAKMESSTFLLVLYPRCTIGLRECLGDSLLRQDDAPTEGSWKTRSGRGLGIR